MIIKLTFCYFIATVAASIGDRQPEYQNLLSGCVKECEIQVKIYFIANFYKSEGDNYFNVFFKKKGFASK